MTGNRTTELLPCPFCGGEVKLTTYRDEGWEIKCENHGWPNATWERPLEASDIAADVGMYSWGLNEDAKAALIAAWNARAERTCRNVHKEWEETMLSGACTEFCCSECGAHYVDGECYYAGLADADEEQIRTNFCPNCGARVGE